MGIDFDVHTIAARAEARVPWYRQPDARYSFRLDNEVEFRRLMDACGPGCVPIWLAARAAEIVVERRGCEFKEAWDRIAFALERQATA